MTSLTSSVKGGGCASKIGPADLSNFLCGIDLLSDPNLLVGMDAPDDAGVYKLRDDLAIIQTLDFFTPMVDDPFVFGQIAAANALSDVYAMGGKPLTAMNIFCFPIKTLDKSIAKKIISGGANMLKKAECLLVGGHSVMDEEIKYGLSVTGIIHPDKIKTKHGIRKGDVIILTKPLGTGVISTSLKAQMASDSAVAGILSSMTTLNRSASEAMENFDVSACTDVTGFGLAGSLYECLLGSELTAVLSLDKIPFFEEAPEYAQMGLMPQGLYRNRDFYSPSIALKNDIADDIRYQLIFDPQTSGGLLIFATESDSGILLETLKADGVGNACIIGHLDSRSENEKPIVCL